MNVNPLLSASFSTTHVSFSPAHICSFTVYHPLSTFSLPLVGFLIYIAQSKSSSPAWTCTPCAQDA